MSGEIKIGIDKRQETYFAARVSFSTGRPAIKSLLRFEQNDIENLTHLGGADLRLAVPDQLVTIKEISLNGNDERNRKKIIFEMSSTVAEPEENFFYDSLPTALDNLSLGMMIRNENIETILQPFSNIENKTGSLIRSAGLARGYINFCQHNEGGLVVLADFNETAISLAFVHYQKILDLGYFNLIPFDLNQETGWNKLATELKIYLNFKQASFMSRNISLPLAALIVSGNNLTPDRLKQLGGFLKTEIKQPQINRGFISGNNQNGSIPLEMYLVALGLTVN